MPDEAGLAGARRILALARALRPADLLLCLFSGGGSALLTLPADGLSLADKREVNGALLRSGAPIAEINCVRKHLSAIKGGRLAAATRSTIRTLAISDVPGDDPQVIASGPTVADPTTLAQALEVLTAYGITPPDAVLVHLLNPANETPKPGDPCFSRAETKVIATPAEALAAAARIAADHGVRALILGDAIQGEAQEVARAHARLALETAEGQGPVPPPCVLISGGETTVTVRGRGRGGRNAEYLLALALALEGHPRIHALAADTDGIDGTETNAGAVIAPDTLERARRLGLDPAARLADNDAFTIFAALSDLLVTGPTRTNVNDFRAILVLDPASDSIPSGQAGTALTKIRGQG
jgi:hydroxypyruvate reductase